MIASEVRHSVLCAALFALACACDSEPNGWTEVVRPPDVDHYSQQELVERARAEADGAQYSEPDPDRPYAYVAGMRFGGARACVDYLNEIVDVHRRKAGSTDLLFYPPLDKDGFSTASRFLAPDAFTVVAVESADKAEVDAVRKLLQRLVAEHADAS